MDLKISNTPNESTRDATYEFHEKISLAMVWLSDQKDLSEFEKLSIFLTSFGNFLLDLSDPFPEVIQKFIETFPFVQAKKENQEKCH